MLQLGPLAFAQPFVLLALAILPVLWWLLRVTPPAPRRLSFPAVRLLLGLVPPEETPARTPWWLILLRTAIALLIIFALALPLIWKIVMGPVTSALEERDDRIEDLLHRNQVITRAARAVRAYLGSDPEILMLLEADRREPQHGKSSE